MSYTITRKLDGQHLARFQIQDGFVEQTCAHLESAFEWLIENARDWNGVQIQPEDVAVYEEVPQPVRGKMLRLRALRSGVKRHF